jgi:hypothetical protein
MDTAVCTVSDGMSSTANQRSRYLISTALEFSERPGISIANVFAAPYLFTLGQIRSVFVLIAILCPASRFRSLGESISIKYNESTMIWSIAVA